MKKRVLALLLAMVLTLGLLPAAALAAGGTVTVTVTMNTQSVAEDVANYELTPLPATAEVTVPAGSTIEAVMEQWAAEQSVALHIEKEDVHYITAIGDFGDAKTEEFARLCTNAGLDGCPVEFQNAGWTYLVNGAYDQGISGTTVNSGDRIDFRYCVYMTSGTWEQVDFTFLDAYNGVGEGIDQAQKAQEEDYTADQWTALQTAKSNAEEIKGVIDTEAEGFWLNYFADKKSSLWGPNSPTDKLQKADKALEYALNKIPAPTGITFQNYTEGMELPLNKTLQINATVMPEGAPQNVTYEAFLGEKKFTVSSTGLITPSAKENTCWVKVASEGNPSVSSFFKFKIVEALTPEQDVKGRLEALCETIALSYASKTNDWSIITSGVFEAAFPKQPILDAEARQARLNSTIDTLDKATVSDNVAAKAILALRGLGYDPTNLTTKNGEKINGVEKLTATTTNSVWNAPYVLLAYQQGEYDPVKEAEVLKFVLAEQGGDGAWASSPDTTGIVLASLAAYRGDEKVDEAIQKGVAHLKSTIGEAGTYNSQGADYNADSTAMAVIGLAAVGEDLTQVKHQTTGIDILEGLLSFALADNSGFGYTNDTDINPLATQDGFWAVISVLKGNSYSLFDFTANPQTPAVATPEQGGSEGGGGGDTPGGETMNVSFTLKTHNATWIPKYTLSVEKDATVGDAFKTAMKDRTGFSYVDNSGYISSITNNGATLAEFTHGANSGWKYMVNGVAYGVGMNSKTLAAGDDLVWYYVTDYTADTDRDEGSFTPAKPTTPETSQEGEKTVVELKPSAATDKNGEAKASLTDKDLAAALDSAKKGDAEALVLIPQITGEAGAVTVELSARSAAAIAKEGMDVRVDTGLASVSLNAESLGELGAQSGKKISVTARAGENGSLTLEIKAGDDAMKTLAGGLTVALPVEKTTPGAVLVLVGENGSETVVKLSAAEGNVLTARLSGSATVKVVDNAKTFEDVPQGHWAADATAFVTSRELLKGTGEGVFAPEASMTRASLMTILYRLEGQEEPAVSAGQPWYAPAQSWAVDKGLSDGANPDGEMTRQELATLLYRYAGAKAEEGKLTAPDGQSVAPWAAEAMSWATAEGILSGDHNGLLNPTGAASRAEVSVMLERFVKTLLK